MSAPEDEIPWEPLLDVSQVDLRALFAGQDTALARCVQRLVDSLDDPDGIISAFQSFIS